MDHFCSGLEQGSALAYVVPLGELEQDASWGRRILPPELTQSLGTEPDARVVGSRSRGWLGAPTTPCVLSRSCPTVCSYPGHDVE